MLQNGLSINIMSQAQHKIYYKGNPYTRQNYIPNSALKNRGLKNYLVQFPQGKQYFTGSRKKQYTNLHHHSEIRQTNLFYQQPATYTHGTYEVADIEGAGPNSLISQAIKNRMKGNYLQNSRINGSNKANYNNQGQNNKYTDAKVSQYQRKRLSNGNEQTNYHLRHNRVQTEPLENYNNQDYNPPKTQHAKHRPSNHIQQQIVQFKYNPETRNIPEATQTQNYTKINDLERELFRKEQVRLRPSLSSPKQQYNFKSAINSVQQIKDYDLTPKIGSRLNNMQSKQQEFQNNNRNRSIQAMKHMWHGDTHRIRLFPNKQIRKLNPTFLSTDNYADQAYQSGTYIGPIM